MLGIPSALFIFLFDTLKSKEKALPVELLRMNTPRGTKITFSTPERYDEHHCPFYMKVPPGNRISFG